MVTVKQVTAAGKKHKQKRPYTHKQVIHLLRHMSDSQSWQWTCRAKYDVRGWDRGGDIPPIDSELYMDSSTVAAGRRSGLFKHVGAEENQTNPALEPKAVS